MEADVLQWSLLVIGSIVIVGVAIHGIWVSRKNNENKSKHASSPSSKQQLQSARQKSAADYADENDRIDLAFDEQSFSLKNEPIVDEQDFSFTPVESDALEKTGASINESNIVPEFDDLGLGAVRVVSSIEKQESKDSSEKPVANKSEQSDTGQTNKVVKSNSKIYASVVTQPKPEYAAKYQSLAAETVAISQQEKVKSSKNHTPAKAATAESGGNTNNQFSPNGHYQAPEPPPFLLKEQPNDTVVSNPLTTDSPTKSETIKKDNLADTKTTEKSNDSIVSAEKLSLGEQARNLVKRKKSEALKKRQEPQIAEDQMRIDFDDAPALKTEPVGSEAKNSNTEQQAEPQQQQEVLVLNVKVPDGETIAGAALLPMLLTLGFKFGEQDIFHRHVNSNGKGPVLFSLANMFKPGNFDIDNLENFTTQGISLFMILPIEGEPHQVFNMMHNAARKIADEFSGQIFDGRRALLTKQSLQQYVEKIREFERKRMLNR